MPFIDFTPTAYPATGNLPLRVWVDQKRAPTSNDFKNFNVSDIWIYEAHSAWIMIDKTATSGLWVNFGANFVGISTLTGNVGGAVPADGSGNINVVGGTNVTITGVAGANTLTATLGGAISNSFPTDSGTAIPAAGALTVHGAGGITTSGAGSTVTVTAGATIPTTFTEDAGSAVPALNNLNIKGGAGITTSGSGSTVTIAASGNVADSYPCDSGTAVPSGNVLNVNGSNGIVTSGSGNTITISVNGGGISWTEVLVVGPTSIVADHGYVTNNGSQVGLTLPLTAPFGSEIHIVGKGAGGWILNQNAGQSIQVVSSTTTTGVTGTLAASEPHACVLLRCITANTLWSAETSMGNLIIT